MSLRFTPPANQTWNYGVYTEGSGFTTHRDLGSAKQSLMAKTGMYYKGARTARAAVITELIGGEWYVLHEVPAGTDYSDLPWVKTIERENWSYGQKQYITSTKTKAVPMTREEYAEWRVAVELERRGITE